MLLKIYQLKALWKHEDNVVCIHPGWDLFRGWLAIRESWLTIFRNTHMIKFIITNTKVRLFNNITVVVCLENIETLVNEKIVRLGVIATNIFERMENRWLLIHHHSSSVSPNIS
jgi:ketosteroid isomerase-like protein